MGRRTHARDRKSDTNRVAKAGRVRYERRESRLANREEASEFAATFLPPDYYRFDGEGGPDELRAAASYSNPGWLENRIPPEWRGEADAEYDLEGEVS